MTEEISNSQQSSNNTTHSEQFIPIIKAILLGKYCWACILFLDLLGYNPTEYIPYQTYIRVLKDNYLPGMASLKHVESSDFDVTRISRN